MALKLNLTKRLNRSHQILERSGLARSAALASRLHACTSRHPCNHLACESCRYSEQEKIKSRGIEFLKTKDFSRLKFITIDIGAIPLVGCSERLPGMVDDVRLLLRRRLQNHPVGARIRFFGAFEIKAKTEVDSRKYPVEGSASHFALLHVHILADTDGMSDSDVKVFLRDIFPSEVDRRVHITALDDNAEEQATNVIGYSFKYSFSHENSGLSSTEDSYEELFAHYVGGMESIRKEGVKGLLITSKDRSSNRVSVSNTVSECLNHNDNHFVSTPSDVTCSCTPVIHPVSSNVSSLTITAADEAKSEITAKTSSYAKLKEVICRRTPAKPQPSIIEKHNALSVLKTKIERAEKRQFRAHDDDKSVKIGIRIQKLMKERDAIKAEMRESARIRKAISENYSESVFESVTIFDL